MDNPPDFKALATKVGSDIFASVKVALADEWDSVSDSTKEDIKWTSMRMAELTYRNLQGEDVSSQLAMVQSIVLDWKAGGNFRTAAIAEKAQANFWRGVEKVAGVLAEFLLAAARGGLRGLTGGIV